jgi:hypothetical protein
LIPSLPPRGLVLALLVLAGLPALFVPTPAEPAGSVTPAPAPVSSGESTTKIDDEQLEYLLKIHHTEQEDVRLVLLPAVVTNRKGKIITGLDVDDFSVSEDHVPQQIRYFSTEEVDAISVAFLLDVSGSMRQVGKLEEAKESIRIFIDALGRRVRADLLCRRPGGLDYRVHRRS